MFRFTMNGTELDINVRIEDKIEDIKYKIKYKYDIKNWLMFKFCCDKPIREYGKLDLIPGDIPLTMDRKKFNDFSMRNDIIYEFEVYEMIETPKKQKVLKNIQNVQNVQKYNIDDINEFPSLR